jgi:sugar/nucleoside kinase (ribokinase family)
MSKIYDVYGVGHALVDVQYSVPVQFLQSTGVEKGIMTLVDDRRQEELSAALDQDAIASASGGSAANTMIGVALFGGSAYYACEIGDDSWGDFYSEDLRKAGVASNPANRKQGTTGRCMVFVTPDADRTLNTYLGVSSQIGPAQLEEEKIAESSYIYMEGYLLSSDNGFDACRTAQQLARKHDTRVSLTLSDPFMVESFRERFARLIGDGVDLLFCNESEALAYCANSNRDEACSILTAAVGSVCITCGSEGAWLATGDSRRQVPGIEVEAVDTTGAGDMFAAGVLFGITHSFSLEDAGKLGSYSAGLVVSRYGPRLAEKLDDKIDEILAHFH